MFKKLLLTSFLAVFILIFNSNLKAQTEMLSGTNMESVAEWQTSFLNTVAGSEPTATWNYTSDAPVAGVGGNLHAIGTANSLPGYNNVQYCIWQAVHMSSDSVYNFDGAFKAVQVNNTWCEVFIGTDAPVDGQDYGAGQTNIANFGTWSPVTNWDGTFAVDANGSKSFSPAVTGDFFFVLKMGSTSWDDTDQVFEIMIDELSLTRELSVTVPPVFSGGLIIGGNMENESDWGVSFLNTPPGDEPVGVWNETTKVTSAGTGGCLNIIGNANDATVQYCIYQAVTLDADSLYVFDAAIKDFTAGLDQSWCEVFIGNQPIDGLDYTDADGTKISEFSTWSGECSHNGIDGSFGLDACMDGSFIPPASGLYYFVLKLGSISWDGTDKPFDVSLDELSLRSYRVKPIAQFYAENPLGFVPLTVQFVDESSFADSWTWDFGDGSPLSSDQSPSHEYSTIGLYSVTLTASNEVGDSTITKVDYISVNELPILPPGEKLYGGNMENRMLWNVTELNATASSAAVWNYTDNTPAFGDGGCLNITATVQNTTSQYCIWQQVELKADSIYHFDGAFRDMTGVNQFWSEVMIGNVAPSDGEDYSVTTDGIDFIAYFNTWESCTGNMFDGLFTEGACPGIFTNVGEYVPVADGTYYFVLKTGATDWEGTEISFDILLDELTLMESTNTPAPVADFFVDITSGDAPLTVYFTDLSENASAWDWDFGDGGTSTEQHPSYTYTTPGVYTVSLTAWNGDLSDVYEAVDLITVNQGVGIESLNSDQLSIYPTPSAGIINIETKDIDLNNISIFDISGKEINYSIISSDAGNAQVELSDNGIYFIRVQREDTVMTERIIIQK